LEKDNTEFLKGHPRVQVSHRRLSLDGAGFSSSVLLLLFVVCGGVGRKYIFQEVLGQRLE